DAAGTEALVRQASAVQRDWLPPERLRRILDVSFDPDSERVVARRQVFYEDLLLEETPAALPEHEQVARVLAEAASQHLDRVLPAADSPAGIYLARIRCLRGWLPELGLPGFDEAMLREIMTTLCHGSRSFADL